MTFTLSPAAAKSAAPAIPNCSNRALVIGLDGATYDLLVPLAENGVMPNLAALMRRAALAELSSTKPFITPVAWTSFLTGCDVAEHGILDYRYLDHRTGELRLNHAGRIARPTIYDHVAAAGGQVVSLNLPMTYPAPTNVGGIVVGGLDSPSLAHALTPFPEFARRLRDRGIPCDMHTIWKRKPQSFAELTVNIARTAAAFRGQVAAARLADELLPWQLLVVQFQSLDALQHRCWHLLSPREAGAPSSWTREANRAMRALDHCVGDLLELAEKRGAAALVVSDHGFGPFFGKISVPAILKQQGWMRRQSLPARAAYRCARSAWKVRKWLARRGGRRRGALPRPLQALLPIDWRRSLCFCAHGDLAAMVYLNDVRRTGCGPLRTACQREQAEAEIIGTLKSLRLPETDGPLFVDVYSARQRWGFDPVEEMWPEIIAIPRDGFHTQSKLDRQSTLIADEVALTGTHRRTGVLMVYASGVRIGARQTAHIKDVAPTILAMLGLKSGAEMTGKVLAELWQQGEDAAIESSASNSRETGVVQIADSMKLVKSHCVGDAHAVISAAEQVIVEERLRALGYLE